MTDEILDNQVQPKFYFLKDLSFWSLLLTNILIIFYAITDHWSFYNTFLTVWIQTVIIGIFNLIRLSQFKKHFPNEYQENIETVNQLKNTCIDFPVVYIILFYALCIFSMFLNINIFSLIKWSAVFYSACLFFTNHLFSFIYNKPSNLDNQYFIDKIHSSASRIVSMQVVLMMAFISLGQKFLNSIYIIMSFLIIKGTIDIVMHVIEHRSNNILITNNMKGLFEEKFSQITMKLLPIIIAIFFIVIFVYVYLPPIFRILIK